MANIENTKPMDDVLRQRYSGCLFAGAAGDALGSTVEFMSLENIQSHFGSNGIRDFAKCYEYAGAITDDTQMTLFTAEGLLRAYVRDQSLGLDFSYAPVVDNAYQRWLRTQGYSAPLLDQLPDNNHVDSDWRSGWLIKHKELFHQRAPGNTCINALLDKKALGDIAVNDSKGCGGLMRIAPVGLFQAHDLHRDEQIFEMGCTVAGLTHGHPTGQLAAGFFALLITKIIRGIPLSNAIDSILSILQMQPNHAETRQAIENALILAEQNPASKLALPQLGEGWVAEEALAIALYCTLSCETLEEAIVLAVNHSGDSDSTGSITGHLVGALYGVNSIPGRWRDELECHVIIETIANDLFSFPEWKLAKSLESDKYAQALSRYSGY